MSQVDHKDRSHALLSASGSDRWLNCTASARLEENFQDVESEEALQGTLAHELAELMLKVDLKLITMNSFRGQMEKLRKHELYYYEMEEQLMTYVRYVKEQFTEAKRVDKAGAKLFIEQKFDLSKYVEKGFGTSDSAIVFSQQLEVIDLKFGEGVAVKAEHNSQLKYYGLGVLEALGPQAQAQDVQMVKLTIVQPRMDNISSWSIPAKFLRAWGEDVLRVKAEEAFEGLGEQVPGEWCQFCKVKPRCRALSEIAKPVIQQAKIDTNIEDDRVLSDNELVELFKVAEVTKNWLNKLKDYMLKQALKGKSWQTLKLVEGNTRRQFKDEAKVIEVLEDNLYEREQFTNVKLKGLGDLEKLLKRKNFEALLGNLIEKPQGAPTLVEESDKRPDWGVDRLKKAFDDGFEDPDNDDDLF
jgi:hypothetical protein